MASVYPYPNHYLIRWEDAFIPLDSLRLVTSNYLGGCRLELQFDHDSERYLFKFETVEKRDQAREVLCVAWDQFKKAATAIAAAADATQRSVD